MSAFDALRLDGTCQARNALAASRRARRSGFTLIEVLMGVLVLGLGLLGLAAIFPAVVLQQKAAADAVEGETAATTAEAALRGTEVFSSRTLVLPPRRDTGRYWSVFETLVRDDSFSPLGGWETGALNAVELNPDDGSLQIQLTGIDGASTRADSLPVTARLIPAIKRPENLTNDAQWRDLATRGDEPRFVWDFVLRRSAGVQLVPPAPSGVARSPEQIAADGVQAAIFVRRIDTGIRTAGDAQPLSRRLLTSNPRIVPVSVDGNGAPQNTGVGRYSAIREGVADRTAEPREMDMTNFQPAALRSFIAQAGQKFVVGGSDAEPGVYEVLRVRRETTPTARLILELDKPLPVSRTGDPDVTFLYTPQVPVTVRLVTIDPSRVD